MESGVHDSNVANMPLNFNKSQANNILRTKDPKHITPNGAGTIIWANDKLSKDINNEKIQTTLLTIKTT